MRRDIACHHGTGSHHRLVADGDTVDDCHIGHYPNTIADVDGFDGERINILERCLGGDATMGGDGAAVTDGGVVTDGNLFGESPIEKNIVSDIYAFANTDAAPASHRGAPAFERDEEGQTGKAESPELDKGVLYLSQWIV